MPSHRSVAWGMLAAAVALFVWRALQFDFVSDDAFISLRYVWNLLRGDGLVFNPGERVEGFSNPLFVLLTAAVAGLGADPLAVARGLSLAGALGLFAATWALWPGGDPRFRAFAVGLLAVNPHLAIWARGGLEATLYASLLLLACLPLLAERIERRGFALCSLAALAAAATRPEGAALYPLFLAIAAWRAREDRRVLWPGMALFAAGIAAILLARQGYYGEWLPNTYHVKSALSARHVERGFAYLGAWARHPWVLPALGLAAFACWRRRDRFVAVPAALLLALAAGVVAVGGDGLPAYRFVVPLLAPLCLLAAMGACDVASVLGLRLGRAGMVAGALPPLLLVAFAFAPRHDEQFEFYRYQQRFEVPAWTRAGAWVAGNTPPETLVAAVPVGALAYYGDRPVLDMLGLNDKQIARVERRDLGAGWAGHEKTDGAYVLDREPDLLLLGNVFVDRRPAFDDRALAPHRNPNILARERDVVEDPRFRRDYRPFNAPLGDGWYLHGFLRRDSDLQFDQP